MKGIIITIIVSLLIILITKYVAAKIWCAKYLKKINHDNY